MGVPQNIQWFTNSFHRCWLLLMMPRKWAVDPFYRGENGAQSGEGLTCLTQHVGDTARSERWDVGSAKDCWEKPEAYLPGFRGPTPSSPRHPPPFTPPTLLNNLSPTQASHPG